MYEKGKIARNHSQERSKIVGKEFADSKRYLKIYEIQFITNETENILYFKAYKGII